MNIKQKIKLNKENLSVMILALILIAEIVFLVYCNLFHTEDMIEFDFAKLLRHTIEMSRQNTIFLRNWDYLTTGELDCPAPLGALFYTFTGNVFLSYGLANILNIAIWLAVLLKTVKILHMDQRIAMLALVFIFMPYEYGMLSYTNMLFIGGGQYVYKALIPLLMTVLILMPEGERRTPLNVFFLILYAALVVITGISSGIYVFICGLFPVMLCTLVIVLFSQGTFKIDKYRILICTGTFVLTVIGFILCKKFEIEPNSAGMTLLTQEEFFSAVPQILKDCIRLFGGMGQFKYSLTSVYGVAGLARLFAAFVMILLGIFSAGKVFCIPLLKKDDTKNIVFSYKDFYEACAMSVFFWNVFILSVTGTQPRYLLIGMILLMLAGFMNLEKLCSQLEGKAVYLILLFSAFGALVIFGGSTIYSLEKYFPSKGDTVPKEAIRVMEQYDVNTSFALYHSDTNELSRVYDLKRVYERFDPDQMSVTNYDYYMIDRDRSVFEDRNIIYGSPEDFDLCPDYIKDSYQMIEENEYFTVWISDHNSLDGISGPLRREVTVDLPSNAEYEINGQLTADGWLQTSEQGTVLKSPEWNLDKMKRCILKADIDADKEVYLDLYDGEDLIDTVSINGETETDISSYHDFRFTVRNEYNQMITVRSFTFEAE